MEIEYDRKTFYAYFFGRNGDQPVDKNPIFGQFPLQKLPNIRPKSDSIVHYNGNVAVLWWVGTR